MCAPSECVRNCRVSNFDFGFSLKIKSDEWIVEETGNDIDSIGWWTDAHNERFLTKKGLTLVGFGDANADFSFSSTDD